MKTFKILGLIILAMIIAFFVGAFFLPKEVNISKSQAIEAPMDTIYNLVNDFHQWNRWSPWNDTALHYTFVGPESGVGAVMRWVDAKGQVGERTIETSDYPNKINILTQFREEESEAKMEFGFKQLEANKVELTISFKMENQFSYPFGRYIAWMIQAGVDVSFPRAMQSIKDVAEPKMTE